VFNLFGSPLNIILHFCVNAVTMFVGNFSHKDMKHDIRNSLRLAVFLQTLQNVLDVAVNTVAD
jgi:hypothetical protein